MKTKKRTAKKSSVKKTATKKATKKKTAARKPKKMAAKKNNAPKEQTSLKDYENQQATDHNHNGGMEMNERVEQIRADQEATKAKNQRPRRSNYHNYGA